MGPDELDLVNDHPLYYEAPTDPAEVDTGTIPYLTLPGRGTIDSSAFQEASEAVETVAEFLGSNPRNENPPFRLAPLETLWGAQDEAPTAGIPADGGRFKVLTRVPGFVHRDRVDTARREAEARPQAPNRVGEVTYETMGAGPCAHVIHKGTPETIDETFQRLVAFVEDRQLETHGPLHEIYYSQPPRQAATVLRVRVQPAEDADA